MANPTTNYGFVLPTSTDLVTDLPADFDVALQGVDTRLKALQPGTTLGDLMYASATANTNTRLPIGSNGQVLSISGGVPAWASGSSAKVVNIGNTQTGTVATGTTVLPTDNTIPQNTEGDQYMSLSFTPSSATNKLQIVANAFGGCNSNSHMTIALFQDSVANALAATTVYTTNGPSNNYAGVLSHTMTAGTTSAITFKVRIGMDQAGTFTFNGRAGNQFFGGVAASSITVMEYTP